MKKITFFVLISLLLGNLSATAQDLKLTVGAPQKIAAQTILLQSGAIGDKIYAVTSPMRKNEYSMLIYNSTTLDLEKEVIFKERGGQKKGAIGNDFTYKTAYFFKNQIVLFFETFEKTSKNRLLVYQKMDLDGNFVGDLTSIASIPAPKKSNSGSFNINISEDSTKILVVSHPPYDKKADERFILKSYDPDLKQIATYDLTVPYKDKKTSFHGYFISNAGDAYLLLNVEKEKAAKSKGTDDSFYSILSITLSSTPAMTEYQLELDKRAVKSVGMRIDNDKNRLLCSGFYSDIKTRASRTRDIDGFFYMTLDAGSKQIVTQSYKELTDDIINQLLGKREGAKVKEGRGINQSFVITNQLSHKDGSSIIVAENSYIRHVTTCSSNGVCITREYHHRDNVFLISISATGEVKAFYDIPKRQVTVHNSRFISFLTMYNKDDKTIFLFNDHPKNITRDIKTVKDVKRMNNPAKSKLTAVELLPDGNLQRSQFVLDKSFKLVGMPALGKEIGKGKYVIPAIKGNKFALLKFEL